MSNGYMKKSISWYALWKRIGKQPLHKTQNTKAQVLTNGELKECTLVFASNGSDFYLEPVGSVNEREDRHIVPVVCTCVDMDNSKLH